MEKSSLRLEANRLGTVSEVTDFLNDLESAYNNIYAFEFVVDTLVHERVRNRKQVDERLHRLRGYWKEFMGYKDIPFGPFTYEMFFEDYALLRPKDILPNLIDLQSRIDIDKIVVPDDRLYLSKVNIQSPGFWEVMGCLNPLQQIREYLRDRHERKKDNDYRCKQEEEIGTLEIEERKNRIINQRIQILKDLGYSDTEIRQFVSTMITKPLDKFYGHIDNGQIKGLEE